MLIVFGVCSVFCLLTGGIIGFLAFAVPRLLRLLDKFEGLLESLRANTKSTADACIALYEMQKRIDSESGGLGAGVYETLSDGRLVNMKDLPSNGAILPGGLVSAPGIRPSEVQS